jgi:benzoate membrane transport protein
MTSQEPVNTQASGQAIYAGLLAAFVGFASSFAVVLQGLRGVGATPTQAASGLLALSVACGVCAIVLSLRTRLPVAIAWSTPGAALLSTTVSVEGGFAGAVGAFMICAVGFILAGLWRPLGRAAAAIPSHLANALLAGVLVSLCFAPFKAIAFDPVLGLSILGAWVVGGLIHKLAGVPFALVAFVLVVMFEVELPAGTSATLIAAAVPPVEWITPTFSWSAVLSISVPLFLVTMASQNVAGVAIISSFGYPTRPGPWIATTGVFSFLGAPFGGHAVNLAAITAALCASEDAHPDPARRYWAAVLMGVGMIGCGLLSGLVIAFVSLAPPILIEAVAGLALIGAFSGACVGAFQVPDGREASAVTFLFSASGISLFGISGAFWGLLAGAAMVWLKARSVARRDAQ